MLEYVGKIVDVIQAKVGVSGICVDVIPANVGVIGKMCV